MPGMYRRPVNGHHDKSSVFKEYLFLNSLSSTSHLLSKKLSVQRVSGVVFHQLWGIPIGISHGSCLQRILQLLGLLDAREQGPVVVVCGTEGTSLYQFHSISFLEEDRRHMNSVARLEFNSRKFI